QPVAGWCRLRESRLASTDGRPRSRAAWRVFSGRVHGPRQPEIRRNARLGLGKMARRGFKTVRKRRGFHRRMCRLPQTPAQYELRLHHAHPGSTMSMPRKAIHLLALVLSATLLGCSSAEPELSAVLNQSASLVGELPANPLKWRVISSVIDPASSTMSTLYGNDLAVGHARSNAAHDYPAGA